MIDFIAHIPSRLVEIFVGIVELLALAADYPLAALGIAAVLLGAFSVGGTLLSLRREDKRARRRSHDRHFR